MNKTQYISHYGPSNPSFFILLQKNSFLILERIFLAARKHQNDYLICDEYIEIMLRYSRHWWLNDIEKQVSLIHDNLQAHKCHHLKKDFQLLYTLLQKLLN